MKLRNIAIKNSKEINLDLIKEKQLIVPNQAFEVSDERAKELLAVKIEGNPIVEQIKEIKTKAIDKGE